MPTFADQTEYRCVRAGFWRVEGQSIVRKHGGWIIVQLLKKFRTLQDAIDYIEGM